MVSCKNEHDRSVTTMRSFSTTPEQYVTDGEGNRVAVIVALDEYTQLLEAAEELEAIRSYDEAKASGDEAIPFEDAIREIEQRRG
jgi:hypothetical protein